MGKPRRKVILVAIYVSIGDKADSARNKVFESIQPREYSEAERHTEPDPESVFQGVIYGVRADGEWLAPDTGIRTGTDARAHPGIHVPAFMRSQGKERGGEVSSKVHPLGKRISSRFKAKQFIG